MIQHLCNRAGSVQPNKAEPGSKGKNLLAGDLFLFSFAGSGTSRAIAFALSLNDADDDAPITRMGEA